MAATAGKGGSVVLGTTTPTMIKNWTINHTGDALDATSFDSSGIKDFVVGLTGWDGSFGANWSSNNNNIIIVGTSAKAVFNLGATTRCRSGKILITGIAYGCDAAGIITQDYTFQGSGVLASSS